MSLIEAVGWASFGRRSRLLSVLITSYVGSCRPELLRLNPLPSILGDIVAPKEREPLKLGAVTAFTGYRYVP